MCLANQVVFVPSANNNELGIVILRAHFGQSIDQHVGAFFMGAPADEEDQFFIRRRERCTKRSPSWRGEVKVKLLCMTAVWDYVHFIPGRLKRKLHLAFHDLGADDYPPRLVSKVPLDTIDIPIRLGAN